MAKKPIDINTVLGVNVCSNKKQIRAVLHIEGGKRIYKYFSINKYTYEGALDLAIAAREDMEKFRTKIYKL